MDKTFKLSLIFGIVTISLSISFYLIYFLPSKDKNRQNIKIECATWAKDKAAKDWTRDNRSEGQYNQELYDDYFNRCLREKGI